MNERERGAARKRQLARLVTAEPGVTYAQAAQALGVTPNRVRQIADELGMHCTRELVGGVTVGRLWPTTTIETSPSPSPSSPAGVTPAPEEGPDAESQRALNAVKTLSARVAELEADRAADADTIDEYRRRIAELEIEVGRLSTLRKGVERERDEALAEVERLRAGVDLPPGHRVAVVTIAAADGDPTFTVGGMTVRACPCGALVAGEWTVADPAWPDIREWCRKYHGVDDAIAVTRERIRRELVEAVGWRVGSHASLDVLCSYVRSLRDLAEQQIAENERRRGAR